MPQLIRAVKENIAAANGFLENAKIEVSETNVKMTVYNGADILAEAGAKEFLEKYIRECFGVAVAVEIKGENTATLDSPEYVQMQKEGIKIDVTAVSEPPKPKKPEREYDDLPISVTESGMLISMSEEQSSNA